VPAPTSVAPDVASQLSSILNSLKDSLDKIGSDISNYTGDPTLLTDFTNQKDSLNSLIQQLTDQLPFTSIEQVNDASDGVQALRNNLDDFLKGISSLNLGEANTCI
jgi:uncharacterized phage infection (PIP) family protein YhgE